MLLGIKATLNYVTSNKNILGLFRYNNYKLAQLKSFYYTFVKFYSDHALDVKQLYFIKLKKCLKQNINQ